MKRIWNVLVILCMSIAMVGCSNSPKQETENGFTIVDQAGREVTFEKSADKIASGYYIATTTLIGLGAKDQLVGVEMKADKREIYRQAAPEVLDLPALGNKKMFHVEECAKADPDVVVLPISLQNYVEQLEALDIKVVLLHPETQEGFEEAVKLLAKIAGKETQADAYFAFRDRLASTYLKEQTNTKTVYMAGMELLEAAGNAMFQGELLKEAYANNAISDEEQKSWMNINIETLLSLNPDYLFLEHGGVNVDDVLQDPALSELNAVKNNQVMVFPSTLETWDTPNLSYCLGSLWVYHMLYPDAVSEADVKKETKAFYQEFYGIDVDVDTLGI